MVELIVSICLLDTANKCHEESLTFADVGLLTCMVGGQAQIAAYMERRPRWYVSRWSCRHAGQFAKA
jgi:hypothetical protein